MKQYDFGSRHRPQKPKTHLNRDEKTQYLLSAEEQLLQSISARAPLAQVLNKICSVLDCDIGNVVSLISPPDEDATDLADMAANAKHLGLYSFCSAGVLAENDELLGSLEMYCCVPRSPSTEEFQLIQRAACLAAIAIQRDHEMHGNDNCSLHAHRSMRRYGPEPPAFIN
ncbi:MAG TPA: hypothetical protein VJW93_08650 [Candidatus Acidoferrales bacterium]|nr:hypothetical protein [Candidatus Acidoferrales bacterium]